METKQLRFFWLIIILASTFLPLLCLGQVSMNATGTYSQNFNSLSSSGTSNNFTNNSTISSWYIQREDGNANPNIYAADNGGSNTGRFYSYGTGTNSDRALGILNSGSTEDAAIGLLLRNTSGVTISSITVTYTLEQWRKGSNGAQGVTFRYRTSSSSFSDLNENSDTGWTSVSALDANGPINSGSSGPRDGNSPVNRVTRSNITIPALSLANGDYIMLRWRDINHSNEDHGLGIDDVIINYEVPSVIFLNDITTNNNSANPYTTNQVVDQNAVASGIGRGSGLNYESRNSAYAANSYKTNTSLVSDDYIYFTVSPNIGYQLNFESFDYQEQRTDSRSPRQFSIRSSVNNYATSILNYSLTNEGPNNRSVGLGASQYQSVQSATTFRIYGWDSSGGSNNDREYSINNFAFLGTVTMIPPSVSNTAPTAICDNGSGSVTISGNNLIHVTDVTVGGTSVSIDSQTNTQLVVTVPQGVSGLVTVTNDVASAYGATITLLNAITYYADADGDGFGDASNSVSNCTGQPVGYVTNSLDCDDNLLLYEDADADGFGSMIFVACGGVTNTLDTNDNLVTYLDNDGDGFGSTTMAPSGVTENTDCNDNDNTIYPGATEICFDGILQNCDGELNDGCAPVLTQIRPYFSGVTLQNVNSSIFADIPTGLPNGAAVTGYRYEITNLSTNEFREIEKTSFMVRISETDIVGFSTVYSIKAAVRINNEWQDYGTSLELLTPSIPTTTVSTVCGQVLASIQSTIYATTVTSAVGYEFEVSRIEGGIPVETTTIERSANNFKLIQLNGIEYLYNTEYEVRVRVKANLNGIEGWSLYGAVCSVFTPSAPEAAIDGCGSEAGITPVAMNTPIYASPLAGATQYRFTLSDGLGYSQIYTTSSRFFRLSNFNALETLTPGGQYSVTVETEIYGNFYAGKDCNILVPGGMVIRPTEVTKETIIKNLPTEFNAIAYPNPFATSFAIDVRTSNTETVSLTIYDMTGRLLEVKELNAQDVTNYQFGNRYPSGIYNMIVTQGEETRTVRVVKQ